MDKKTAKLTALAKSEPLRTLVAAFKTRFKKGEIFLVGGSVRDALLARGEGKDLDIVVRGVTPAALEKFLNARGTVNLVGKRFGVWKFLPKAKTSRAEAKPLPADVSPHGNGRALDIALPRTEHSFNEGGYRDVEVTSDPALKIEDDLSRRDFTVNAMAYRLYPKPALIDPFDGQKDLKEKLIRTVGKAEERFREDYSRILRGIRFAAQLGFAIDNDAMTAMRIFMKNLNDFRSTREGNVRVISTEIIAKETIKAFVADPPRAFDLFFETTATDNLMPELLAMRGCPQPENFHSEGDVWTHTRLALSQLHTPAFKKYFNGEKPSPLAVLATLFHDMGKPMTIQTPERDGTDRIRYNGHDQVGADAAEAIAKRLTFSAPEDVGVSPEKIGWIVRHHLFTLHGHIDEIRPSTLEKYFFNPNLPGRELLMVIYADSMAAVTQGGIKPDHLRHLDLLVKRIGELAAMGAGKKLPPPLLDGCCIMKITGLKPGPEVGKLIAALREAQLEGKIATTKEAERFIKNI